ncbi:hypothetical protein Clacol_008050 [Clathrus columnatus]|uniref:TauD/TfdA-like domain-containing protein n=1 Tax=Clathrus columnatus TaxID=1419009 RepID=A0AAV5AL23_9AGAM|nr:hypothetical protein Clacol_008050 [Clathrus columnatus]
MPPTATETVSVLEQQTSTLTLNASREENKTEEVKGPSYPFYYPYFDVNEKFPPTQLFGESSVSALIFRVIHTNSTEHVDAGSRADKAKPNLLKNATLRHLNPYIGTVVKGVQISQLSKEGLDELALLAAERKLLLFRDQDFKDIGPERQIEIAKHFGPIQRHPTSGNVKGYPEFHVVYRDDKENRFKEYFGRNRVSNVNWHSDITYEKQPPCTTIFFILDQPNVGLGGDTLFSSQVEAYNRLSPSFKKVLEGLRAVHSAVEQAEHSRKRGGPVRREPVETEHPLVRVHPVTGEKALFVNEGFTRRIVGFKDEESKLLLNFLFDHIKKGADFHARATYKPGTVVVWDNRVTVHSATNDFDDNVRRHAVRLTPQAEVPIPATEP